MPATAALNARPNLSELEIGLYQPSDWVTLGGFPKSLGVGMRHERIHRSSHCRVLAIGSTFSGWIPRMRRTDSALDELVGFFVNPADSRCVLVSMTCGAPRPSESTNDQYGRTNPISTSRSKTHAFSYPHASEIP